MANRTLSFILREMGSVLDKLIELAGRKADVVCANDTEGLDEIVRAEEQAARDLAALEEERACVIAEEAESYAGEVEELRLALHGKAERLRVLNERNQRLLRQGLELIEFEMKLFMPQPSYKNAARPGPMLVDFRV